MKEDFFLRMLLGLRCMSQLRLGSWKSSLNLIYTWRNSSLSFWQSTTWSNHQQGHELFTSKRKIQWCPASGTDRREGTLQTEQGSNEYYQYYSL